MPPDETTGDGAAWGALPLVQEGRSLRVGAGGHGGLPLLDGMPSSISVAKEEGDIVVLGAASADGPAALADFALGQLHCRRFLALPKTSLYWTSPRFGADVRQVPVETQFLLLELEAQQGGSAGGAAAADIAAEGQAPAPAYALLLPLIDSGKFRATLRPPRVHVDQGGLVLRLESGSPAMAAAAWPSALLVAAGRDPFELCQRAVPAAARLSGAGRPRCDKEVPPSCDVFGWCTWDAFYSMVSAAGIAEGLKSLQAGGTPPRLLIIDDGWQRTEVDAPYRRMAVQRHLVGQVSVPHSQSEVELEDAVVDLLIGPGDERETNTRHAVNSEEEQILGFTPRALTPRQAAAANPFGRTPPWSAALPGLSPRHRPPGGSPLKPAPIVRPASASALLQRPPSPRGAGPPAGSPLRPPPGLPPIVAAPKPLDLDSAGGGGSGAELAAEPAPPEQPVVEAAAAAAEAELQSAMQAGAVVTLYSHLWDRFHHTEAQLLRLLKGWLDEAPSDSWRFRAFSAAATGPLLRPTLLRFYARATEHTRRLAGIEANAKFGSAVAGPDSGDLNSACPEGGLASVVAHLKRTYGLQYVWMWHALAGFWAGVMPGPGPTDKYRAKVVRPRPTPGTLEIDPSYAWVQSTLGGIGLVEDPAQLHADMHAYIKACGADGVKVDVQGMVAHAGTATEVGGPALAAAYHASLEASAARHFPSNSVINCMCGSTENLYNMSGTNLARISDDFYPRNRASFTTHISTCAYNSLFAGELVIPDWDMFHSRHSAALLHATARAISGGPIYISDKPGQHDFGLLRRLVLPDGSVLRCLLPGRPTADCLFCDVNRDGRSALKVWNLNRCTAVVATFNTQGASWSTPRRGFHFHDTDPPAVTARIRPADVPLGVPLWDDGGAAGGGTGGAGFAVYADSCQELTVLQRDSDGVEAQLAPGGCDLFTIAAVQERRGVRFAPIGLTNMLNTGGALASCGWEEPLAPGQAARFRLTTRGRGSVLAYSSTSPNAVEASGGGVRFSYAPATGALRFDVPPGMPLTVDWTLAF